MEHYLEFIQGLWAQFTALPTPIMVIVGLVTMVVVNQLYKMTRSVVSTTYKATKVGYRVVSSPFRIVAWGVNKFTPRDINAEFKNKSHYTIQELIYLNTAIKNNSSAINSDILHNFAQNVLRLRSAQDRPMNLGEVEALFDKNTKGREITRVVLELACRNDPRAQDIISTISKGSKPA